MKFNREVESNPKMMTSIAPSLASIRDSFGLGRVNMSTIFGSLNFSFLQNTAINSESIIGVVTLTIGSQSKEKLKKIENCFLLLKK